LASFSKTSEQLPRSEQDEQLSKLDFIIFMVDFTSPHSLAVLKDALQYVSADYLLDRAWIVVTKRKATPPSDWLCYTENRFHVRDGPNTFYFI
jgi:hypothetical protein